MQTSMAVLWKKGLLEDHVGRQVDQMMCLLLEGVHCLHEVSFEPVEGVQHRLAWDDQEEG